MDKIFSFIQSLPKAVQYAAAVLLVGLLSFAVIRFTVGDRLSKAQPQEQHGPVLLDMPDAVVDRDVSSKISELGSSDRESRSATNRYWESLGAGGDAEGGLMTSGQSSGASEASRSSKGYDGSYLDPTVYSEMEIYYIQHNLATREEIDRKHEEERRMREGIEREERERQRDAATKRSIDSAYLAGLEAMVMADGSYGVRPMPKPEEPKAEAAESEPRTIEIQTAGTLPSASLAVDGIITSLDAGDARAVSTDKDGNVTSSPAKCTFLKTEKVVSGQRIILRLMQDLVLSDGTMIPANTHISGTCSVGGRLTIRISTINYGGRIYYTSLDAYDSDGTEGIYCPSIVEDNAAKSAKRVARNAGRTAGSLLGAAISARNRYAGSMSSTAVSELSRYVDSEGNAAVTVSSGYEFYVFENVKR